MTATSLVAVATSLVIVVVLLVILPSIAVAKLAELKGRSFAVWLGCSLVVTWPIVLVGVLLMRPSFDEA